MASWFFYCQRLGRQCITPPLAGVLAWCKLDDSQEELTKGCRWPQEKSKQRPRLGSSRATSTTSAHLQEELVQLQGVGQAGGARKSWCCSEGATPPGKGVIKAITGAPQPRVCRVTALPAPRIGSAPSGISSATWLHPPAAGRDGAVRPLLRHNRAGVERVMGFCSDDEYREFLRLP